jgi:hypothetical protein
VVQVQSEEQFEQLMLQYNQLKNGAEDIHRMILNEDFDSAMTMIQAREDIFLNCKCMRKYLELTPVQQKALDKLAEAFEESDNNLSAALSSLSEEE